MLFNRAMRIGTRGSRLAWRQAESVREQLLVFHPGLEVVLVPVRTSGDVIRDRPLASFGGKGLFVKEIEEALLADRIDAAVHSMKDLPSELPSGLILAAITQREDPRDVLISKEGHDLMGLPPSCRVGTSSPRRKAQLLHLRPDLLVTDLRGNLDTRLRKLTAGSYDALVVAAAGLNRMGWSPLGCQYLSPSLFLPAIGQGALGLETRADAQWAREMVACLNHQPAFWEVTAERSFARRLGGGCQLPVAAFGRVEGDGLLLTGLVISPDGKEAIKGQVTGPPGRAEELGSRLAEQLLAQGAQEILLSVTQG